MSFLSRYVNTRYIFLLFSFSFPAPFQSLFHGGSSSRPPSGTFPSSSSSSSSSSSFARPTACLWLGTAHSSAARGPIRQPGRAKRPSWHHPARASPSGCWLCHRWCRGQFWVSRHVGTALQTGAQISMARNTRAWETHVFTIGKTQEMKLEGRSGRRKERKEQRERKIK